MEKIKQLNEQRARRARRSRARMFGLSSRPRLSVFRSNRYLYAQLIDDAAERTLAAGSTRGMEPRKKPIEQAFRLGEQLAEKARTLRIEQATLHRGQYRFHGQVKALVEGARAKGLRI